MEKSMLIKKKSMFVGVTFFFFLIMVFLYINISGSMYHNASIKLAVAETAKIGQVILEKQKNYGIRLEPGGEQHFEFLDSLLFTPPVLALSIYSPSKEKLYSRGNVLLLEEGIDIYSALSATRTLQYNITWLKNTAVEVYEVVIPLEEPALNNNAKDLKGYLYIAFNLSESRNKLFEEKNILTTIVILFNFLIIFFLIIMALNMQSRYYLLKSENECITARDEATGLLTREIFLNLVEKEIEREKKYGGNLVLILAEIIPYLSIRENLGEEFAGLMLRKIADIFLDTFREFDYIARLDSNQLIIMMADTDEKESLDTALLCMEKVEENKFYYNGEELTIEMKFGLASSKDMLEEYADISMDKDVAVQILLSNVKKALTFAKTRKSVSLINYNQLKK